MLKLCLKYLNYLEFLKVGISEMFGYFLVILYNSLVFIVVNIYLVILFYNCVVFFKFIIYIFISIFIK